MNKNLKQRIVETLQPLAERAFCPTGEGGGVDPTCGRGVLGSNNRSGSAISFYEEFIGPMNDLGKAALAYAGTSSNDTKATVYELHAKFKDDARYVEILSDPQLSRSNLTRYRSDLSLAANHLISIARRDKRVEKSLKKVKGPAAADLIGRVGRGGDLAKESDSEVSSFIEKYVGYSKEFQQAYKQ